MMPEEGRNPTHTVGVFASLFDAVGRIVLVRQTYAGRCWTQPGGRLEPNETPMEGLLREIYEETGMHARIDSCVGVYVMPHRNDVLLHFRATVIDRQPWNPTSEILECGAFDPSDLPVPIRSHTRDRIADGLTGGIGIFRVIPPGPQSLDVLSRSPST